MKLILFTIYFFSLNAIGQNTLHPNRLEQLTGIKTSNDSKFYWDKKYSNKKFIYGKIPAKFLAENFDYLPENAKILDMGMGEGRNAVFLARKGHLVTGIDISSVAVKKSQMLAKEYGVKIKAITASLSKYNFPKGHFDAIIAFYYVDRKLTKKIMNWLRPGGILIYEAFTVLEREKDSLKTDPVEYFLKNQELITLFKDFKLLKYEEPLHEGTYRASAIFMKPHLELKIKK